MKTEYKFTGRGGETHKLVQTQTSNVYQVVTDYPIGTTGRMNKIIAIDFAGGPMLVVGELMEFSVQVEEITQVNNIGVFVALKEI
jgi:hypothetical protein